MSPILGIYASQISGHLWEPAGAYDALWSTTLSASTSSITISNIPSTYKHLQIRAIARSTDTGGGGINNLVMSFNSDTTYTNYRSHYLNGNGTSVASGSLQIATYYAYCGEMANSISSNTQIYGSAVIDILDYANTNKNKTVRSLTGADRNGLGSISLLSSLWLNTAAINSIVLRFPADNTAEYSSFALYGVK